MNAKKLLNEAARRLKLNEKDLKVADFIEKIKQDDNVAEAVFWIINVEKNYKSVERIMNALPDVLSLKTSVKKYIDNNVAYKDPAEKMKYIREKVLEHIEELIGDGAVELTIDDVEDMDRSYSGDYGDDPMDKYNRRAQRNRGASDYNYKWFGSR